VNYLFDDIFFHHRQFFNWEQSSGTSQLSIENRQFLFDLAYGFRPRKYSPIDTEKVILDEEQEVTEMLFIQQGIIGIGFYHMMQGLTKK
jgi:hypothetical protein